MGHFSRGDVIIARVPFSGGGGEKVRPAVVVISDNNNLIVVPVSSRPSTDMESVPLTLEDFLEGGLDMFRESYVLTSQVTKIHSRDVAGKRGRLTIGCIEQIVSRVPQQGNPRHRRG
jgi:mRNA-degrading endonuclease toxin of MazEF toxin-antitoxin module